MKVRFLHGGDIQRTVCSLMDEHDEYYWAVAWGTSSNPLVKKLFADPSKIRLAVFGIAFAHTSPEVVDALIKIDGGRIVQDFNQGTFHPKIYAFRSKDSAAAVIGSANFTWGGFGKNREACVLLEGSTEDEPISDALKFVTESAKHGVDTTRDFADRYRLAFKRAEAASGRQRDPLSDISMERAKALSGRLIKLEWSEYLRELKDHATHDIDESLGMLSTIQSWLSNTSSFSNLDAPRRKAIAGVLGRREAAREGDVLDRDWGWFGSMRGAGDFAKLIGANNKNIANAIDSIPQRGPVTRDSFNRFAGHFEEAFEGSARTGGAATASRLLAMKRPDAFLCVSNRNKAAAAREMAFSKSTLNLKNYWDRVVEPIRASEWYNVEKPDDAEGQIWEFRAAMLDGILYKSS